MRTECSLGKNVRNNCPDKRKYIRATQIKYLSSLDGDAGYLTAGCCSDECDVAHKCIGKVAFGIPNVEVELIEDDHHVRDSLVALGAFAQMNLKVALTVDRRLRRAVPIAVEIVFAGVEIGVCILAESFVETDDVFFRF